MIFLITQGEFPLKQISADKTYVLRDGEEYDVQFMSELLPSGVKSQVVIHCLQPDGPTSPTRRVSVSIRCLNTDRMACIAYPLSGSYLPDGKPHALDLIERMDWHTGIRDAAPRLLQLGKTYRNRVETGLLFTPMVLGDKLDGLVKVAMSSESTGQRQGETWYSCDGRATFADLDDVFGLIPAYPDCSTWQLGDPLMVREATKPRELARWVRGVFTGRDEDGISVSIHSAPGVWLGPRPSRYTRSWATDIRLPNQEDIRAYTLDWNEAQIDQLYQAISRMRKSWPYPEPTNS
jgi:hypothetical protein